MKQRIIALLLLVPLFQTALAGTNDSLLCVNYKCILPGGKLFDRMKLEIDGKMSRFYSETYYRESFLMDSIIKCTHGDPD